MRKIVAIAYVTLDGVMQSPGAPEEDPRDGFAHGGWMVPYWDQALTDLVNANMAGGFDLLLGRRTYEMLAASWPYMDDNPVTRRFNRARKYVVTRSLDGFDWANTERIDGDVVDAVRRLKADDGPELQVVGSSELLQALVAADLVDEFRVWIFPLVLGEGRRLFEHGVPPRSLLLVDTQRSPAGVLVNTYCPAGAVEPGSFHPVNPPEAELARRRKLAAEDAAG